MHKNSASQLSMVTRFMGRWWIMGHGLWPNNPSISIMLMVQTFLL